MICINIESSPLSSVRSSYKKTSNKYLNFRARSSLLRVAISIKLKVCIATLIQDTNPFVSRLNLLEEDACGDCTTDNGATSLANFSSKCLFECLTQKYWYSCFIIQDNAVNLALNFYIFWLYQKTIVFTTLLRLFQKIVSRFFPSLSRQKRDFSH